MDFEPPEEWTPNSVRRRGPTSDLPGRATGLVTSATAQSTPTAGVRMVPACAFLQRYPLRNWANWIHLRAADGEFIGRHVVPVVAHGDDSG